MGVTTLREANDEVIKRLEKIEQELKKGKKEVASTITREGIHPPRFKLPLLQKKWLFYLVVMIFVVLAGWLGLTKAFSTKVTPDETKASFVEQIQDLSSLATAQAFVKAVLQKEDNQIFGKTIEKNFPGTKRKVLLIIPASVVAGVDLQHLNAEAMQLNEVDHSLVITIPHASIIHDPVLYLDEVQAFSQEGLFRSEMDWKEGFAFASEAKSVVIQEAINQGLLQVAEENAVHTLTQFFNSLGYKTSVQFEQSA